MEGITGKPIAACEANGVEAWFYPFFVRPATDFEPSFLFLEDHLYNLNEDDQGILEGLVRIDSVDDLVRLGLTPDEEGVWRI
jgi:hypothetical protein